MWIWPTNSMLILDVGLEKMMVNHVWPKKYGVTQLPFGYLTSPWKIAMLLIGKPSISMGHLYHGYVK